MAQLAIVAAMAAVSAYGKWQEGQQQKKEANQQAQARDFQAQQLDQQAGQEVAAAQRRAGEEERQSRLMQSRALALAASSGAGASDPTVVNIISDLAGEGAYRAGVQMYEGEARARQARMGAAASRFEGETIRASGKAAARAANIKAGMSIAQSMFSAYTGGMGGGAGGGMGSIFGKYGSMSSSKPGIGKAGYQ